MTAFLLALLMLWPLGFGREQDSTARWWLERPLWFLSAGVILLGLIAIFGRFERGRRIVATARTTPGPGEMPEKGENVNRG
jgi:hypothetical protein